MSTTLSNTGGAPSQPISTSLPGSDFVLVADSCNHAVLQPAQSCTIQVAFRPITIGSKQGTIIVETADICGPTSAGVNLTGTALLPPDAGASD